MGVICRAPVGGNPSAAADKHIHILLHRNSPEARAGLTRSSHRYHRQRSLIRSQPLQATQGGRAVIIPHLGAVHQPTTTAAPSARYSARASIRWSLIPLHPNGIYAVLLAHLLQCCNAAVLQKHQWRPPNRHISWLILHLRTLGGRCTGDAYRHTSSVQTHAHKYVIRAHRTHKARGRGRERARATGDGGRRSLGSRSRRWMGQTYVYLSDPPLTFGR